MKPLLQLIDWPLNTSSGGFPVRGIIVSSDTQCGDGQAMAIGLGSVPCTACMDLTCNLDVSNATELSSAAKYHNHPPDRVLPDSVASTMWCDVHNGRTKMQPHADEPLGKLDYIQKDTAADLC